MKKLVSLFLLLAATCGVSAQSVRIYQGNVVAVANYNDLGDILCSANAITVGGTSFPTSTIDSITFGNEAVEALTVKVAYAATAAKVYVPVPLMKYITAEVSGAHVTLTSTQTEGDEVTYSMSGTTADGSFVQHGSYKCTLELNGVSITNTRGGAVDIDNGKRIDIIAVEGTTNSFVDAASGIQKACFRVKGHSEFKGAGTINITGNITHAYKSGEYTSIRQSFGTLNINAAENDGMHIGQYFETLGGTINVKNVKGDAIQVEYTTTPTDTLNGQMLLNAGTINITSAAVDCDGLKADSIMKVTGGTYNINMSGNGSKGVKVQSADITNTTSTPVFTIYNSGTTYTNPTGANVKAMCFKTDADLYIHAGTINVFPTGVKAKGIKVDGNYYYTPKASVNSAPTVAGYSYPVAD